MKNLKKIFLGIFVFIFAFHFQLNAQQKDNNTIAINKYFQNTAVDNVKSTNQNKVNNTIALSTLTQLGNYNYGFLQNNGKSSNNILQKGNGNNIELYSYYNGNNIMNLVSKQIGNNNSIQIIGTNSLTKEIKITQRANNSAILVRNYN